MRVWAKLVVLVAAAGALIGVGYAELVLDIRTPRSNLQKASALGASALLNMDEYNKKVEKMKNTYGDRAEVALQPSTGGVTVTLDGKVIEEWHITRNFGGMYGIFVVIVPGGTESLFSFDSEPGNIPSGQPPTSDRLRARFPNFPGKFLSFFDDEWTRDSCATPAVRDVGFGPLGVWLGLQSQTYCIEHWKSARPASMLIVVTRAEGDPWMRPFARWLCARTTGAALRKLASVGTVLPDYASCVLVDRPERTGPTGAQTAFTSDVYEIRDGALTRID